MNQRLRWAATLAAGGALAAAVALPLVWFTREPERGAQRWLGDRTDVSGWSFRAIPVEQAAEGLLVAERMVNGEFTSSGGTAVRVFSAARFRSLPNENELFAHPPDRCWIRVGWALETAEPETVPVAWSREFGLTFERRIFSHQGRRELVYFAGTRNGGPLPYRLNQFLDAARGVAPAAAGVSLLERARDGLRAMGLENLKDVFARRAPEAGTKQFVRLSTAIEGGNVPGADALLQEFVVRWLEPGPLSAAATGRPAALPR